MKHFTLWRAVLRVTAALALLLAGSTILASCGSDDEPQNEQPNNNGNGGGSTSSTNELERDYFSVEGGTYNSGSIPSSTVSEEIDGFTINDRGLTGGMNFITIVTQQTFKRFFIGVKGIKGYWIYVPGNVQTTDGYRTYVIPINFSTRYSKDIVVIVIGEFADGGYSKPKEPKVRHVDSESGDIDINLTFSNAKDIDLHLYTPLNEHIYYYNRGGTVLYNNKYYNYGLDHDSNAGCYIDNLNNENIYIPGALVVNGTYRVVVNMYDNCNRNIATSWAAVARYKGEVIKPTYGKNPASGVYPVRAGDDDMTVVMEFKITDANNAPRVDPSSITPFERTLSAIDKYAEWQYRE